MLQPLCGVLQEPCGLLQPLCGLLHHLFRMFHPLYGMLQPLCGLSLTKIWNEEFLLCGVYLTFSNIPRTCPMLTTWAQVGLSFDHRCSRSEIITGDEGKERRRVTIVRNQEKKPMQVTQTGNQDSKPRQGSKIGNAVSVRHIESTWFRITLHSTVPVTL